uniref:aspartyl aminopeptidase n=1 Tax=Parascaris univalens TaxID=6257 RepID=A0A915AN16_PARUN
FHGGVIVKVNMNQRYATTGRTHAVLKQIAHLASCPLQTVDVGCGMLAMHSIRELTCTSSIFQAIALYSAFFKHLPAVLQSLK